MAAWGSDALTWLLLLQSLAMHAVPLPGDDEEKRGCCFVIFYLCRAVDANSCCWVGNGVPTTQSVFSSVRCKRKKILRFESSQFEALNEVYLQNFLHRWVVNRETNLMMLINP